MLFHLEYSHKDMRFSKTLGKICPGFILWGKGEDKEEQALSFVLILCVQSCSLCVDRVVMSRFQCKKMQSVLLTVALRGPPLPLKLDLQQIVVCSSCP